MRIGVWHNLGSGGGKRALYEQVAGLAARGHAVEAWCPSHADPHYLPLSGLITEHVLPTPPVTWDLGAAGGPQRLVQRFRQTQTHLNIMLAHGRACAAEMAARDYDVLLAHPCRYLRVPTVGRYLNLPKVLYLQEPDRQLYEADPHLPWPAPDLPPGFWRSPRRLAEWAVDAVRVQTLRRRAREELTSVQAFDEVLVNSLYSRESLLRAYGREAAVCYLGVDAERFRPTGAPRENLVVSVGAFTPAKRVEHVVRAVGSLAAARRPALVWIANFAQPAYQQAMEALAQACGVSLTVLVGVPDEALVSWLSRAAALIYAPRREPFGLAPLEAGACETPVVAVAEGGVRETVVDGVTGVLVTDNAPEALGAALGRVLDRPDWARELGAAGRRAVRERWTWARAVEALEGHLRRAAERA